MLGDEIRLHLESIWSEEVRHHLQGDPASNPTDCLTHFLCRSTEDPFLNEVDRHAFYEELESWIFNIFVKDLPYRNSEDPEKKVLEVDSRLHHILHEHGFGSHKNCNRNQITQAIEGSSECYGNLLSNFHFQLATFFRESVSSSYLTKTQEQRVNWEKAISVFIDDGLFHKALEDFRISRGLEIMDEEACARIFYVTFRSHFDSRKGLGFTEMIKVGRSHPDELKKMTLMDEYDDIRVALLRLQLTGKIRSLNYR